MPASPQIPPQPHKSPQTPRFPPNSPWMSGSPKSPQTPRFPQIPPLDAWVPQVSLDVRVSPNPPNLPPKHLGPPSLPWMLGSPKFPQFLLKSLQTPGFPQIPPGCLGPPSPPGSPQSPPKYWVPPQTLPASFSLYLQRCGRRGGPGFPRTKRWAMRLSTAKATGVRRRRGEQGRQHRGQEKAATGSPGRATGRQRRQQLWLQAKRTGSRSGCPQVGHEVSRASRASGPRSGGPEGAMACGRRVRGV